MKILQQNNVDEVIGVQKQHKFKITDQSQAIIMDSLINLYSDPIGSIVREITSNCIDANRERDLKIDGKIPKDEGDDQLFWGSKQTVSIEYVEKNTILGIDECMMFHDHGCGLSEDRVANVFTTFGASTKRDNNYEIGGFGLGAKSPLAYTETFYVRSRHNGTETYYMLYRNNDNVPHMDQVFQTSTEEKNGSTVIVPIKEYYDKSKFRDAISEQLCFFDNIVFKGVVEGLGNITKYYGKDLHKSVIEEKDDFLITNDGKQVDLLVGRVVYPINWDQLDLDEYDYKASMCVKFDIGVLDLVPSRESIRYTPKTISVIEAKFKAVKAEFGKDVSTKYAGVTNYIDFIKSTGSINSGSRYSTLNSNDPLAIKASMGNLSMTDITFSPTPSMSPKMSADAVGGFHHIFNGIHIFKIGISNNSKAIGGKTISRIEVSSYSELSNLLDSSDCIYHVEGNFNTAKEAAILAEKDYFLCFKASKDKFGARVDAPKSNLRDSRAEWQQTTMYNSTLKHLKAYSGYSDYNAVIELELDDQFGDIVDNKTRRKLNKEVFARRAYIDSGYSVEIKYNNYEYKISNLQEQIEDENKSLNYVVYAESCDEEWLKKAVTVISSAANHRSSRYYSDLYDMDRNVLCFKVAKSVAKDFKNLEGFINAKDLFMETKNHDKLTKFCTGYRINQMLGEVRFLNDFEKLHPALFDAYRNLYEYERNNTWSAWSSSVDDVMAEILNVPGIDEKVIIDQDMAKAMEDTSAYAKDIQLLNYVSFNGSEVWECVQDFLSLKGKPFGEEVIEEKIEEEETITA